MPNILRIAARACVEVLVPEPPCACIYLMLYYVKLHEIKFYVPCSKYIQLFPPLPPLPGAFRASQNPPPCPGTVLHGFRQRQAGMPSRTARSRVAPTSHHPRAQSPRPVWACDTRLFFN